MLMKNGYNVAVRIDKEPHECHWQQLFITRLFLLALNDEKKEYDKI